MDRCDPWVWIRDPRNHSPQRWAVLGWLDARGLAAEQRQKFHAPILLGSRYAESVLRAPNARPISAPSLSLSGPFTDLDLDYSTFRLPSLGLHDYVQPAASDGNLPAAAFVSCVFRYIRWRREPSIYLQDCHFLCSLFLRNDDHRPTKPGRQHRLFRLVDSLLRVFHGQFDAGLFLGIPSFLRVARAHQIVGRV